MSVVALYLLLLKATVTSFAGMGRCRKSGRTSW